MSEALRLADRVANLEARLLDEISPDLEEGARVLETTRRIEQGIAWLKLSRLAAEEPADQRQLAQAHTYLLKALNLVREVTR